MIEKNQNKQKRGWGWPIFLKKPYKSNRYLNYHRDQNNVCNKTYIVLSGPQKVFNNSFTYSAWRVVKLPNLRSLDRWFNALKAKPYFYCQKIVFFKKMGQSWPLFPFIFVFSTCYNSNSNLNWKKHRWCAWDSNPGGRMDGANKSTELRWHPKLSLFWRLFC